MLKAQLVVFTYLITRDLVETLERKIGLKLNEEIKNYARDLENKFISEFFCFIPANIERKVISASKISEDLDQLARRNTLPIVSLDRIYVTRADDYLEVTRVTDLRTGKVNISARPGNKSLDEQIDLLKKYKKIVLADVGSFEGTTLIEICNRLEQAGIKIEEIYLGFSSYSASTKISNNRKLTAIYLFEFYEWIELRDFFGIDGRAVKSSSLIKSYVPYWENLTNWASVPKESELIVSNLCKEYYALLVGRLSQEGYDVRKIGTPVKLEGNIK